MRTLWVRRTLPPHHIAYTDLWNLDPDVDVRIGLLRLVSVTKVAPHRTRHTAGDETWNSDPEHLTALSLPVHPGETGTTRRSITSRLHFLLHTNRNRRKDMVYCPRDLDLAREITELEVQSLRDLRRGSHNRWWTHIEVLIAALRKLLLLAGPHVERKRTARLDRDPATTRRGHVLGLRGWKRDEETATGGMGADPELVCVILLVAGLTSWLVLRGCRPLGEASLGSGPDGGVSRPRHVDRGGWLGRLSLCQRSGE